MRKLLTQAEGLIAAATDQLEAAAPALPVQPYQHFEQNPYYLVAGTYLSAISLVLSVQLMLQSYAARLEQHLEAERRLASSSVSHP